MALTTSKPKDPNRSVRVIVAEPMRLQIIGEEAMRHVEVGERVAITLQDARNANAGSNGRVLFLDQADDPTRGTLTASAQDVKRIELMAAARAAEQARRDERGAVDAAGGGLSPAMVKQIAAIVAMTMQQVMKP